MATLKEIAKLAKVSITTVSRTLNFDNTLSISDIKKKKIFEIAEELEYKTPRRKKIESGPKLNIGLVYWYTLVQELEDPYYLSIRRGIERCSEKNNINILKIPKVGDKFSFEAFSNMDGIIAVGKFANSEIRTFAEVTKNIVFVDFSSFEGKYDSIVIDFKKAIHEVLNYFIEEKGHTNIGYLGGTEYVHNKNIIIGERRKQYFVEYMKKKDLYVPENIISSTFSSLSGYNMMKEMLSYKNHPKAYFAANDSIAIGAIKAIHEAKLEIPKDIAIVGFNDIPNATYTFPPLTTVKVETEFMGEKAVELIMEQIDGRKVAVKLTVSTSLVKRESI